MPPPGARLKAEPPSEAPAPAPAPRRDPLDLADFSQGFWQPNGALAAAWQAQEDGAGAGGAPPGGAFDDAGRSGLRAVAVAGFGLVPAAAGGGAAGRDRGVGEERRGEPLGLGGGGGAAAAELERRKKRLARNRASARLRRQRKKTLVEAYEYEVTILEAAMRRLGSHRWGGGGAIAEPLGAFAARPCVAVPQDVESIAACGASGLAAAAALSCDKAPSVPSGDAVQQRWQSVLQGLVQQVDSMLAEVGAIALLPRLVAAQAKAEAEAEAGAAGGGPRQRSESADLRDEAFGALGAVDAERRELVMAQEGSARKHLTRLLLVRKALAAAAMTPKLTLRQVHSVMGHFQRILHAPQRRRFLHWCAFHEGHLLRLFAQEDRLRIGPAQRRRLHQTTRRISAQYPSGYAGLAMMPPTPKGPAAPITAKQRKNQPPIKDEAALQRDEPQMMLMDQDGEPVPVQVAVLRGAPLVFQFGEAIALQHAQEAGEKSPNVQAAAAEAAAVAAAAVPTSAT